MEIGKYIEAKIDEIKQKHYYAGWLNHTDADLKRRWKSDKEELDAEWQKIKTNKDVFDLIDRFDGTVSWVEKYVTVGHIEDAYNMALAFHKALTALRKMSQNMEVCSFIKTEFTRISEEEVNDIFARLDSIATRMDEQNMRRAMSD